MISKKEHMFQKRNIEYELMLALAKKNMHQRELAKLLDEPLSNIHRELNRLVNLNIIDFDEEGRNKTYHIKKGIIARNHILMAEIYKLSKLLSIYPGLQPIVQDILSQGKQSPMVILFGSYANFNAKMESDIDLYMETDDRKIKGAAEKIDSRLSVKIGDFDLDNLLVKEIVINHVIIKGFERFYEKIGFFN